MNRYTIQFQEPFPLENGRELQNTQVTYHTYGKLNADKSNVVWVCHALTANSDVFEWWSGLFGDNELFNPQDYFIICANILGSHYGTTSPLSKNKATNEPYFHDFPLITIRDITNFHIRLKEHLKIDKIHTLIGASLGGQQALEWSIIQPEHIDNLILIATNAQHSSWGVAFNESQRLAIENDVTWLERNTSAGINGLKTARSIALLSYRHWRTYNATQKNPLEAKSYQQYQGEKLSKRFNAFSYWYLSHAMDSHDISRSRSSIIDTLKTIQARALIVTIQDDILFPESDQEAMSKHIANAQHIRIPSLYGHDGFLIETEALSLEIGKFLKKAS